MITLRDLQKLFIDGLYENQKEIVNLVCENTLMSAKQHFTIYQNSIIGALQKTLKETYPVCFKLVGEHFFIAMIDEYIIQHPSTSPDLSHYGKNLPEFISQFQPADSLAYLSDVAALEWAWNKIHYAAESPSFDFNKLAIYYENHSENILFILPTNCTLLSSCFPIHQIWEMNQDNYIGEEILVLKDNQTYFYLIWRNQLAMRIDILSQEEWQILSWIQQKLILGKIAELITAQFPNINLTKLLSKLIEKGWLCDFVF